MALQPIAPGTGVPDDIDVINEIPADGEPVEYQADEWARIDASPGAGEAGAQTVAGIERQRSAPGTFTY